MSWQDRYNEQKQAADSTGSGLEGYLYPLLSVDADSKGMGVAFCFRFLPDFDTIQQRCYADPIMPFFTAPVHNNLAETRHCYFSPAVQFPGTAQQAGQDLFGEHLQDVGIRWEKNDKLTPAQQEYRRGLNATNRTLCYVVMCDPNTAQPIILGDGRPDIRIFAPAGKHWEDNGWWTWINHAASNGVMVSDPYRGCVVKGLRKGKAKEDTSYTCQGLMLQGQGYPLFWNQDGSPKEDWISWLLGFVRPWGEVLEVPSIEKQTEILGIYKAARFAKAFPNMAGPGQGQQIPAQVQPAMPQPGAVPAGMPPQPGVGAPTMPPGMPQPGAVPPGMPQPGAVPPGMPQQPGAVPPGMPQQPGVGAPMTPPGMPPQPAMPQPGAVPPGMPPQPAMPGLPQQPTMPTPGAPGGPAMPGAVPGGPAMPTPAPGPGAFPGGPGGAPGWGGGPPSGATPAGNPNPTRF